MSSTVLKEAERLVAVEHMIGVLSSLKIEDDVFRILAKRRNLPFGGGGELIGEKPYQRAALLKILKDSGLTAEVLREQVSA